MNIERIANRVALAGLKTYELLRVVQTKNGARFEVGETVVLVKYGNTYPWYVYLESEDGSRKFILPMSRAWMYLRGFHKPPSLGTMTHWSDGGIARAVDGVKVEPDGFSPSGAPSWLLVEGIL